MWIKQLRLTAPPPRVAGRPATTGGPDSAPAVSTCGIDYLDTVRAFRARRRARYHRPPPTAMAPIPVASHCTDAPCNSVQSATHNIGLR